MTTKGKLEKGETIWFRTHLEGDPILVSPSTVQKQTKEYIKRSELDKEKRKTMNKKTKVIGKKGTRRGTRRA